MKKIKPIFFYTVLLLFCVAFSLNASGYDFDLWARLIAGMGFVQTGQVLKHDFLSYTPTHLWYDHEWGSGVIFYLTQHLFSGAGLIILQALLLFSLFFIITRIVKLRGLQTTTAYNFLFYFFALISMSAVINEPIRCQMFTFVLFALFLYILELARKGENRPLFALPFIMILWNNLHGGCVSGIGLIVIYIIGELLNKKEIKKYIYVLIPTVLALVINPWGLDYLGFLANAVSMKRPDVIEWWGLFSKFYLYKYMVLKFFMLTLLIAKLVGTKSFSYQKMDKTKFLILFATLYLAISHVKMVPFFVITATCFLYDDFYAVIDKITVKIHKNLIFLKEVLVYLLITTFILTTINVKAFESIVNESKYPIKEIEFIKINHINGNLLINFGLGSYASYKLYPDNLIFMDGRYEEVYYDYMVPMMKKFYLLNPGWDEILIKYPPAVMVIEKYYPVYNILKTKKNWELVYEGKLFGVFVKSKPSVGFKKDYKQPSADIEHYKKNFFDTNISFKKLPL